MNAVLTALMWVAAIVVATPVMMLAIECLVGTRRAHQRHGADEPPPFTVLMPAHDEALGIERPIRAVTSQLRVRDVLIVIADNCSDDTAAIARRLGAHVIERDEPEFRGKGYALEAGRLAVVDNPGRVVIVVDADCVAMPGALRLLASTAARRCSVVQGAYLLAPPADASGLVRLSAFAFVVKNLVRQLGLRRMSGAALLQGSGMAFPHAIFRQLDWCAQSLVEDLDLGIALLAASHPVTFEERALFVSATASREATIGQRRRWEHGMMRSMARNVPMLLRAGSAGRPRLLIVALDQMVPPATPLIASALVTLAMTLATGVWSAALLLAAALILLAIGVIAAWRQFGRHLVPLATLTQTAHYFAWKLPLAVQFFTRRERHWLRTGREPRT